MSRPLLPFPWTIDGEGLCPVLCDPDLLGSIVERAGDGLREDIIRIARPVRNRLVPAELYNSTVTTARGRNLGQYALKVLEDPKKRADLFRRMRRALKNQKPSTYLAQLVYNACNEIHKSVFPAIDTVCSERNNKHFLDRTKFETWLLGLELNEEHIQPLALFACAFAILQPQDASWIFEVLVARNAGFAPFLSKSASGDGCSLRAASTTPSQILASGGQCVDSPESVSKCEGHTGGADAIPLQASALVPTASRKILELFQEGRDWTQDLPLDGFREAVSLLRQEVAKERKVHQAVEQLSGQLGSVFAGQSMPSSTVEAMTRLATLDSQIESLVAERAYLGAVVFDRLEQRLLRNEERLAQLDDSLDRLRSQFDAIRRLPWLEPSHSRDAWLTLPAGANLQVAQKHIDAVRTDVSRILTADSLLRDLRDRLQETSVPIVTGDRVQLGDIADRLEESVSNGQRRFAELAAREKNATDFLERLAAVTSRSSMLFINETTAETWVDLGHFLISARRVTEAAKRFSVLADRFDLAGLLVAHLWELEASAAVELIASTLLNASRPVRRNQRRDLLAFISFDQLQELAIAKPEIAPDIADLIFATALRTQEQAPQAYLETLIDLVTLPQPCVGLYRACLDEWRAGAPVTADRLMQPATRTETSPHLAEQRRQNLLRLVQQKPSLSHNYYRLRLLARTHFLEPLNDALNADDSDKALKQWQSFGDLNGIVKECAQLLQRGGRHQKLDQSHYQQTRNYLEAFENELRQWHALRRAVQINRSEVLTPAMNALRRDAETKPHAASSCALETIRLVREANHSALPQPEFGQRLASPESGATVLLNAQSTLNPLMTWTWPLAAKQGTVPLSLVLADRLREALGAGPRTLNDAVEEYWQNEEFLAVRDAAADDPVLRQQVGARLEKKKEDILSARKELLAEADANKEYEPDIEFWMQEIHRCLDAFEFDSIPKLFQELDASVVAAVARRDPVRLGLLDFLREAGVASDENSPREELQRQVEEVKSMNQDRRLHVLELEKARDNAVLPELLREQWTVVARRLDRPANWPSEDAALEVACAIPHFVAFLAGHLQDRESDPEIADLLVETFTEWLPLQCSDPTFASPAGVMALQQLKKLAEDIVAHRSDRSILRSLGYSAPALILPDVPTSVPIVAKPAIPSAPSRTAVESRSREGHIDSEDVYRRIRSFLAERMKREQIVEGDPMRLRSAVRSQRWREARELAADLVRRASVVEGHPPTDVEAVYAVALAHSAEGIERQEFLAIQQNACIAVLATERSQYQFYVPTTLFKEFDFAARAVVLACDAHGIEQVSSSAFSEHLGQVFTKLVELAPTDLASEWLRELFWMASRLGNTVSARLAGQLWEALRGKDNDESRASLLRLLFRLRRNEALRHLAGNAEPVDDLIKVCLTAFEQAEEDSSVRPQAREILITLREQAYGKRNTRPWISLFQHLEATRSEVGEQPVVCSLQSDYLTREGSEGQAVVEVLLTPSLADPPRSLSIHFLTDPAAGKSDPAPVTVVSEDEMLLRAKALPLVIPGAALVVTGDVIDVTYRLHGETVLHKPIDLPGRWTFPNTYQNVGELLEDDLARAWPGASGDPVVSGDLHWADSIASHGFHGREEEQVRIERYLRAVGRGRSLMVFGERRIGKTSLLLETVQNYPPRRGAVCGAFFDLSGLPTPAGPGEMQGAFFNGVISKLATEPVNEPIRRALTQATGREVSFETISHGLRPKVALEDALEGLVQRLEQVSNGLISRMAFFFDEFDLFVEPLLRGQRDEVLKLHGSLRQIIQRSQRIMLVLAGSGLQRLFTEDYLHPFYGSIDELPVKPFDWATASGRRSIEETFLPPAFRPQLCPGDRFPEVAQRAADLTGGHPYYLSMLGFAAARGWRGNPLTPALLNRVADLLIQNKIEGGTVEINRRKFYQPVFQSLKRLTDHEQAVARLMLASIARLTSTDRQRWKKWRLIEDQFIEDPEVRRLTSEDERLTALKHLQKESVVEFDKGRSDIRIRIPLTAAAIREDARDIHDEAIRQLRALTGRNG